MGERMDPGIWGMLPEEIMLSILTWLPLYSFLRLRSVCKKWNGLVNVPSFQRRYIRNECQPPLLITRTVAKPAQAFATYNSASDAWQVGLPSFFSLKPMVKGPIPVISAAGMVLRSDGGLFVEETGQLMVREGASVPLATAGGLVLWETVEFVKIDGRVLYKQGPLFVSNPLIKSEKKLPPLHVDLSSVRAFHATIALDRETSQYNVILMCPTCPGVSEDISTEGLVAEVYDSRKTTWESMGRVPKKFFYDGMWHVSSALYKQNLYTVLREGSSYQPHGVCLYRVGSGSRDSLKNQFWFEIETNLTVNAVFANLFESKGNLMVGILEWGEVQVQIFHLDVSNDKLYGMYKVEGMQQPNVSYNIVHSVFRGFEDYTFHIIIADAEKDVQLLMSSRSERRPVYGYPLLKSRLSNVLVYEPRLDLHV